MKLLHLISILSICGPALGAAPLPKDVSNFLAHRESCDHWRGEYGYDAERQADIDWSICQACTGTDVKLVKLKRKYKDQESILAKLNDLEPQIESKDKAAAKHFCKKTRKPEWYK